jgi:hypothetical protein
MNAPSAKKNVFRRHPILTGFAGLSLAFIIFAMLTQNTEYKKLDYSKAIVTDDHAIVCPQSLLFDLRADHDANAILDAFTALSSRDEKARALGCEVLQGGIAVTAHRMSAPFDTYVSVGLSGTGSDEFFTMESELKNDPLAQVASAPTAGTVGTSPQTIADSNDTARLSFQAQLEKLEKPMPNLRWLPTGQDELLVTPYGPCAYLGVRPPQYIVTTMHLNPYMPSVPVSIVGTFADKGTAATAAEKYCHEWYVAETGNAQNKAVTDHMWFTPDTEEAVSAPAEAPAAIIVPSPDNNPASTQASPSEAPARDGPAPLQYNTQFDQELTACVLSNAPHNGSSSPDTGSYALHILNDSCQRQYSAWIEKCVATGDTQRNCVSTSLKLAQDELKQFAK